MEIQESQLSKKITKFWQNKKSKWRAVGFLILIYIIAFFVNPKIFFPENLKLLSPFIPLAIFFASQITVKAIFGMIPHFFCSLGLWILQFLSFKPFFNVKHMLLKQILRDFFIFSALIFPYFFTPYNKIGFSGTFELVGYLVIFTIIVFFWIFIIRPLFTLTQKLLTGKITYNRYTPAIWAVILSVLTLIQAIYSRF